MAFLGYGYVDAYDITATEDTEEWLIDQVLPRGIGFTAGLPKGGNSPFGGKSVWQRAKAYALITGEPFLGKFKVNQTGQCLSVNLDESAQNQAKFFIKQAPKEARGFMISNALAVQFPNDLNRLEEDIKSLKPLIVNIDPLFRTLGGRDINDQKNTAQIIDGLKALRNKYNVTIDVCHHSTKDAGRNKESTSTWLNGSVDLDSAWDFCHCIEYSKKDNIMHGRLFLRYKPKWDCFYYATKTVENEITGVKWVPEAAKADAARKIWTLLTSNPSISSHELARLSGVAQSSVRYHIDKLKLGGALEAENQPLMSEQNGQKNTPPSAQQVGV